MKLNAREQLVLVVVLVILVWIGGVVAFIKPSIDAVNDASNLLSDKQMELAGKQQRIEDDKNLKEDIKVAYAKATETASVFYPRMIQHYAAKKVQTLLDGGENVDIDNRIIKNQNLTVSTINRSNIKRYVYSPNEVNASLDTIVSKVSEEEATGQIVEKAIDMTAYTFSFSFVAEKQDLMKFLDSLQTNEQRSLVVTSLSIANVDENEDTTEWAGSMNMIFYMAPELPEPDDVNKQDKETETVDAKE